MSDEIELRTTLYEWRYKGEVLVTATRDEDRVWIDPPDGVKRIEPMWLISTKEVSVLVGDTQLQHIGGRLTKIEAERRNSLDDIEQAYDVKFKDHKPDASPSHWLEWNPPLS